MKVFHALSGPGKIEKSFTDVLVIEPVATVTYNINTPAYTRKAHGSGNALFSALRSFSYEYGWRSVIRHDANAPCFFHFILRKDRDTNQNFREAYYDIDGRTA